MHIYAFTKRDTSPIPYYERTFGCAGSAIAWAGMKAGRFVTNTVPPRFWY